MEGDGTTEKGSLFHNGFFMAINPDKIRKRRRKAAEGYLELDMPRHAWRELSHIDDCGVELLQICLQCGEALQTKLEHRLALDAYRQAHLANPTNLHALFGMAWCFKRIDQLSQAIDSMKLAYQFHKDVPEVLYNLACYYSLAGEKENALSWLGRSLRMKRELLNSIPEETDFDPLRHDSDFQHLLELSSNQ